MLPTEWLPALGSATGVVVTVWMFLRFLGKRDKDYVEASKSRDERYLEASRIQNERMVIVVNKNSDVLTAQTQISGQMVEALRRINGH